MVWEEGAISVESDGLAAIARSMPGFRGRLARALTRPFARPLLNVGTGSSPVTASVVWYRLRLGPGPRALTSRSFCEMGLNGLGDLQVHDVQKCCFIRLPDGVDGLEVGQ